MKKEKKNEQHRKCRKAPDKIQYTLLIKKKKKTPLSKLGIKENIFAWIKKKQHLYITPYLNVNTFSMR